MTSAREWIEGKHWHPSIGWTNHGLAECRATVADSENLQILRRVLEAVRAKRAAK